MLVKFLVISLFIVFSYAQNEKNLVIQGTGDSQELLRGLATIYKTYSGNEVVIPDSIGSGGGIKKLIKGDINIARVARPLKDKEKVHGFTYKIFAYSPVVFVVNTDIKKNINLNTNDILDIYSSKIINWSDLKHAGINGKIYLINREKGDSSRSILEKNMEGFINIKETTGIIANYNNQAVEFIKKYKNTVGYLSMPNTINTDLKIASIDGIFPSIDNIKNDKYKYKTPLAFVFKGTLENNAKSFLDFLETPEAKKFMLKSGVIPN